MLDAQGQHLPLDQGALDVVVLTAPNIAREIITKTTLYVKSVRQIMETICFLIQAGVYYEKYYGRGGGMVAVEKMKNEELGKKMKKGKEKGRKIT